MAFLTRKGIILMSLGRGLTDISWLNYTLRKCMSHYDFYSIKVTCKEIWINTKNLTSLPLFRVITVLNYIGVSLQMQKGIYTTVRISSKLTGLLPLSPPWESCGLFLSLRGDEQAAAKSDDKFRWNYTDVLFFPH